MQDNIAHLHLHSTHDTRCNMQHTTHDTQADASTQGYNLVFMYRYVYEYLYTIHRLSPLSLYFIDTMALKRTKTILVCSAGSGAVVMFKRSTARCLRIACALCCSLIRNKEQPRIQNRPSYSTLEHDHPISFINPRNSHDDDLKVEESRNC